MEIDQVMARHQDRLMAIPGVTGVGIGEQGGRPAIVVMVVRLTPQVRAQIPQQLEGFPVVVDQSGEITPF